MLEPLYALKQDLDMVTNDVQELKHSYDLLDYIAKVVHDSELEQLSQARQMRRMEQRLDAVEQRLDAVEQRLDAVEQRLATIESRLESIEKTLLLITKHLGIS